MVLHGYSVMWKPTKLHIAVNKSEEGIKKQKIKYRRVVFGQNSPSNSIDLVAMEIITNRKKGHEERALNIKTKVTSGYFCGQEMLSML